MKKQITVISIVLVIAMVMTGCSWEDVKSKFVGGDNSASGTSISLDEIDTEECITLGTYKGVEVDCTVSDDEIQSQIDTLLSSNPNVKKIKKGTCKKGQSVNIDYVGKMNGKKFDGGSEEGRTIVLGSSGFIDGFDDGVIGMKVGEKKDVKLKFPSEYQPNPDLAGKDAVFTVTVNYIEKSEDAKFDDAFVKKNTNYKTVAEYKTKTKESLVNSKKESAGSTALETVQSSSKFLSIPDALKESCNNQLDSYYHYMATSYGYTDFNAFLTQMNMTEDAYKKTLAESADTLAKTQLLTAAIAAKENLSVTDDEIKKEISDAVAANASSGGDGADESALREQFKSIYGDAITLEEYFKINLLNDKVINFLKENAKIKE